MGDREGEVLRSGFVAVLGRPNVGKSTLLNAVLGTKLVAVTPKPQTTRHRILGVYDLPDAQLVFMDTPGVHKARSALNKAMVEAAYTAIHDADVVLLLVEAGPLPRGARPKPGKAVEAIIDRLRRAGVPAVLGLNKIDLVDEATLIPFLDEYGKLHDFEALVPISARTGQGVEHLVEVLASLLPPGPRLFPEGQLSDRAQRFFVSELIREQIFLSTRQEVPYGCTVVVDRFVEPRQPGRKVEIDATVVVDNDRHKAIIIGRRGQGIKALGTSSRAAIEELLGQGVVLRLHVKVKPGWSEDTRALRDLGYDT